MNKLGTRISLLFSIFLIVVPSWCLYQATYAFHSLMVEAAQGHLSGHGLAVLGGACAILATLSLMVGLAGVILLFGVVLTLCLTKREDADRVD